MCATPQPPAWWHLEGPRAGIAARVENLYHSWALADELLAAEICASYIILNKPPSRDSKSSGVPISARWPWSMTTISSQDKTPESLQRPWMGVIESMGRYGHVWWM